MRPSIEIEIDELVLHDVETGSLASFHDALEAALIERFQALGVPDAWLPRAAEGASHASLASRAVLRGGGAPGLAESVVDAVHGAAPSTERSR